MTVRLPRQIVVSRAVRYRAVVMADAPVRYWKLDELTGNASDSAGSGVPGTHGAGVTRGVAGPVDRAASYDGSTTAYTNCGSIPSTLYPPTALGDAITLECIYEGTGAGTNAAGGTVGPRGPFISANDSTSHKAFVWGMEADGVPAVWLGQTYVKAAALSAVNDGSACHVCCVVVRTGSGWDVSFYKNGGLDRAVTVSAGSNSGLPDLLLGRNGRNAVSCLDGVLDEVAMYDYGLSAAQVAAHHAML